MVGFQGVFVNPRVPSRLWSPGSGEWTEDFRSLKEETRLEARYRFVLKEKRLKALYPVLYYHVNVKA